MNIVNILIGGPAGTGIEAVSHSFALSFTREGLFAHTTSEYENLIRGGHNFSAVRISDKELTSHSDLFDVMIAMDKRSVLQHTTDVREGGAFVFDATKVTQEDLEAEAPELKKRQMIGMPLQAIAEEAGLKLAANVVAAGAVLAVMDRDIESFKTVLETIFKRKGQEIIDINFKALEAGFNYVKENSDLHVPFTAQGDGKKRFLMNGNEAIALGCIKAGMKYLAAYPMTPGSTIMTTLAKEARNYDVVVSHVEDEIAAVNMAIGAGYTGIRAATSTSGGGFALMAEATGLSAMIEAPVVIFNAQRPGPSTGLPTRTGQADLRMAMHCGQGDFPRMVIAGGDHDDCVKLTIESFNFAEKYQIPVVFLTEKYVADSYKSCEMDIAEGIEIDRGKIASQEDLQKAIEAGTEFPRYVDSEDGVSTRSIPGQKGGEYTATSYEHDAFGQPVEEVEDVKITMEKRWRKMAEMEAEIPAPKSYGEADTIVYVWGGTKGPALEAQKILEEQGTNVQVVQMQYLHPFKKEAIETMFAGKKVICVEGNQSGQLESILMENTGIRPDHSIRNYYGRPMTGQWIADEIQKLKIKN